MLNLSTGVLLMMNDAAASAATTKKVYYSLHKRQNTNKRERIEVYLAIAAYVALPRILGKIKRSASGEGPRTYLHRSKKSHRATNRPPRLRNDQHEKFHGKGHEMGFEGTFHKSQAGDKPNSLGIWRGWCWFHSRWRLNKPLLRYRHLLRHRHRLTPHLRERECRERQRHCHATAGEHSAPFIFDSWTRNP